jgi:hypothetical protein
MKDKFALNYKQVAKGTDLQHEGGTGPSRSAGLRTREKQNYLHDHRTQDSLMEYLDNLEE